MYSTKRWTTAFYYDRELHTYFSIAMNIGVIQFTVGLHESRSEIKPCVNRVNLLRP